MDIKLTVEEHAVLSLTRNHVPLTLGGKGNHLIHIHSPADMITLTRGLCVQRLLGSSHHASIIDGFFDKLEEIFGLPFSDLDPNPYTQDPTS